MITRRLTGAARGPRRLGLCRGMAVQSAERDVVSTGMVGMGMGMGMGMGGSPRRKERKEGDVSGCDLVFASL